MRMALLKDLAKYLPAQIIPAITGFLTIIVATRLFPPSDYGYYVLIVASVTLASTVAAAWLGNSIIRFYPAYQTKGELNKFYGLLTKLAFISIGSIGTIFISTLIIARNQISADHKLLLFIGLLIFIGNSIFMIILDLTRAKGQAILYSLMVALKSVVGLVIGIVLVIAFDAGIEGLLWGVLIILVILLPILVRVSLRKPSLKGSSVRSLESWELVRYGLPMMAVAIAGWILSLSDRYIIEIIRGSTQVGIYSASYSIAESSILVIVYAFGLASFPMGFMIWEKEGANAVHSFLNRLSRYFLLVGIPATVGLSILSGPILRTVAASDYQEGAKVIPIIATGILFYGILQPFSMCLGFFKRTDLVLACFLGAALLNVGLNFLMVPKFGYMGAALGSLMSYLCFMVSLCFISRRFLVWQFPFKSLEKAIVASAVMGILIYPISNNLISRDWISIVVGIFTGVVIYLVMLALLREIEDDEMNAINKLRTRLWEKIRTTITKY